MKSGYQGGKAASAAGDQGAQGAAGHCNFWADPELRDMFCLGKLIEASFLSSFVVDAAGVLCPRCTGDFLLLHISSLSAAEAQWPSSGSPEASHHTLFPLTPGL